METAELEIIDEVVTPRFETGLNECETPGPGDGDPGRTVEYFVAESSLGVVLVGVTELGVCAVLLGDEAAGLKEDLAGRFPGRRIRPGDEPGSLVRRVVACVDGETVGTDGLAIDLKGTDFQKSVWNALREIPPGATVTYATIASRIGRPSSVRAVARACGANPLAVLVPCHRVLRADGGISGYRWGVERKRTLLDRERASSPV
jgi:AraC family transcriptional regulator of adaptative response/methylated-DNA-[protein]-cysteine methyltransferase